METYNVNDLRIWENLFETIPGENWRAAPPSKAMEACRDFFIENKVRRVWDVGCGPGRWAIYLAKNGLRVKGSDFSDKAVRIARNWTTEEVLHVDFARRAVTERAFPGERFEGVVAALVLDNVSREEMIIGINLMRESLVDEGCLFALFNPVMTEEMINTQIKCENPTAGITQVNYSDSEIISAFTGFNVINQETFEAKMRGFFLKKASEN